MKNIYQEKDIKIHLKAWSRAVNVLFIVAVMKIYIMNACSLSIMHITYQLIAALNNSFVEIRTSFTVKETIIA